VEVQAVEAVPEVEAEFFAEAPPQKLKVSTAGLSDGDLKPVSASPSDIGSGGAHQRTAAAFQHVPNMCGALDVLTAMHLDGILHSCHIRCNARKDI
jgi:hypothetical protein